MTAPSAKTLPLAGLLRTFGDGVAARVPMNATAYPLRGTELSSLVAAEWDKPPGVRNYLPPGTPECIRDVYGINHPRLARIKARYDPENLFRSNQNILPGKRS